MPRPNLRPKPRLTPSQRPGVPLQPAPRYGFLSPVPDLGPIPLEELDPDRCKCPKKARKKREPRTVCYRGTFREGYNRTTKTKIEEIPCEIQKTVKQKLKSLKTKVKKKVTKNMKDLARDVFQIPFL